MNSASLLAFLAVPMVTGAASALWAPISRLTWTGMSLINLVTYAAIWLAMILFRRNDPGLSEAVRVLGWWPILAYVGLTCAVSMGWFVALSGTHVVWIAVGETAWPVSVLLATLALSRWTSLPVSAPVLSFWHLSGAILIVIGVCIVSVAEQRVGATAIPADPATNGGR